MTASSTAAARPHEAASLTGPRPVAPPEPLRDTTDTPGLRRRGVPRASPRAQGPSRRDRARTPAPWGPPDHAPFPDHAACLDHAPFPDHAPIPDHAAQGPRPATLVDPRLWGTQFAQAAVEVAAGLRTPAQLLCWASADVHATLSRRNTLAARVARTEGRTAHSLRVRTLHMRPLGPDVYEACAVFCETRQVRALAFRIERRRSRWRVTALEMG